MIGAGRPICRLMPIYGDASAAAAVNDSMPIQNKGLRLMMENEFTMETEQFP
jgi:hypothetical protein